jgi:hypothetical protein
MDSLTKTYRDPREYSLQDHRTCVQESLRGRNRAVGQAPVQQSRANSAGRNHGRAFFPLFAKARAGVTVLVVLPAPSLCIAMAKYVCLG